MRSLHFHSIAFAATEDNRWPENGFSSNACCTSSPRPLNDLRISVTPATSQIRMPDGRDIIGFPRSARGAARPATLVTGSQASFCRGGTQPQQEVAFSTEN